MMNAADNPAAPFHVSRRQLVFRPLAPTDSIAEITLMLHRAYKPMSNQGFRYFCSYQTEKVTRSRLEAGEAFVAEFRGQIIGTITLYPPGQTRGAPWYNRPEVAMASQFAVEPDYQRQGIGSELLQLVESRAKQLSAAELSVDMAEGATELIRYFKRRGYRFIEYVDWNTTNFISVILSKIL